MDTDDFANWQRHSWFLLASQWLQEHRVESEFDSDEGVVIRAEKLVEQGSLDSERVFP